LFAVLLFVICNNSFKLISIVSASGLLPVATQLLYKYIFPLVEERNNPRTARLNRFIASLRTQTHFRSSLASRSASSSLSSIRRVAFQPTFPSARTSHCVVELFEFGEDFCDEFQFGRPGRRGASRLAFRLDPEPKFSAHVKFRRIPHGGLFFRIALASIN
jgi:hypothetical protein